ncbi:solute carrier family 22 member 8 isoform X3 [Papio anubis]|uniref:solute carrier family 22 member 8 isoform X3 n=1 Tax=Papio anubis TaxID=9555 RepID=UPI00083EDADB|nr:solute carrier family 22 member 8 isoform X3 [Papio anubis]
MTFSEILDRVGSMGRFQFLHVAILGLPILNMANHNLLQIFTAATPVHHCRPPPNASAGPWVIPMGPNGKPERCLRFVHPSNASLPNDTQRSMEPCLDGWVYNSTKDSIVTEWNLVCNSNKLKEMAQSIFMAGILIGGLVLGDLSDRFGRRPILTCSYLLLAASGSGAAFSPTFPVYVVFRFLCGCGISGITLSTVILNVEWVPTRMRAIMSTALGYCYTVGQFILPGLAYAIPQWRWLQLTVSIPFFIFFLSSWWTPESIRWLVLTGKSSKALKILRRVAAFNGKKEEGERLSLELSRIQSGCQDVPAMTIPVLLRGAYCKDMHDGKGRHPGKCFPGTPPGSMHGDPIWSTTFGQSPHAVSTHRSLASCPVYKWKSLEEFLISAPSISQDNQATRHKAHSVSQNSLLRMLRGAWHTLGICWTPPQVNHFKPMVRARDLSKTVLYDL